MSADRCSSVAVLACLLAAACGGDDESAPVVGGAGGSGPQGCAPGTLAAVDGGCVPVGIPADGCAPGFDFVDDACISSLPSEACAPGQLALPGELSCRDVAPCDGSRWGAAPIDGGTEFVDQSFVGVADGSESAPWPTIADAIANAAPGALIAIAQGSYNEDVSLRRRLRLWGSCTAEVEIVGSSSALGVIDVRNGAVGSEIHDLSIRGGAAGYVASGALDLLLERVYVHDTAGRAVVVEGALGPTSATLRDSLIERAHEFGVIAIGADLTIERTVVRDTQALAGAFGRGVESSYDPTGGDHSLTLTASLVERNHEVGVYVAGHTVTIDASVIRDTLPGADGTSGRGVMCQLSTTGAARCNLQLSRSVIERNQGFGVYIGSSDATVETTVIRDTIESLLGVGRGIDASEMPAAPGERSSLTLRDSLVTGNTQHGVNIIGSDALLERTMVRDNLPQQSTLKWGEGIMIQLSAFTRTPSSVTVQSCSVQRNFDFGILVVGSDATIVNTAVSATSGRASDDLFGDGIAVVSDLGPASATIIDSLIDRSHRAGLANFGAALALADSLLDCSAIDIASEPLDGTQPQFDDQGDNRCGCSKEHTECRAVSTGIEPPNPVQQ
jgi:hypothetical protein